MRYQDVLLQSAIVRRPPLLLGVHSDELAHEQRRGPPRGPRERSEQATPVEMSALLVRVLKLRGQGPGSGERLLVWSESDSSEVLWFGVKARTSTPQFRSRSR